MSMFSRRELLSCSTASLLAGCMGRRLAWADAAPAQGLRDLVSTCGIEIGGSEPSRRIAEPGRVLDRIARECSVFTGGLSFKWDRLRPAPDKFDFSGADGVTSFARSREMKVRGHTLTWHLALPSWFSSTITKSNARSYLSDHINTVVKRYAGQVYSWDVVNEPIDLKSDRIDKLRTAPWLDLVGEDYIQMAFQTAAAADPNAQLVLNDYGVECDYAAHHEKRQPLLQLLANLKRKNVPIHALGIQSHLPAGAPIGDLDYLRFLSSVRDLGLDIIITEMDVNDTSVLTPDRDAIVARTYSDYLSVMRKGARCKTIVFGTFTDRSNWYDADPSLKRSDGSDHRPGLLDPDLREKPAYQAVRKVLVEQYCGPLNSPSESDKQPPI
jgi:endo-1,4-beta-xylanase